MSTYVITGASRGIGYAMVQQISEDPQNLVIGLVRDVAATKKKVATGLADRSNVHILHADLENYASLKEAVKDTEPVVGDRGIDYLVANGAFMSTFDAFGPIGALAENVEEVDRIAAKFFQTNVTGNLHLFNLFLPLVQKSKVKKVVGISSGHADLGLINTVGVEEAPLYAAAKAAMNVIVAKFSTQYKKDGVLFFSMSPGAIDTFQFEGMPQETIQAIQEGFVRKFSPYYPTFKGFTSLETAIPLIRSTWERASIEGGYGGAFVSQFGNGHWL